MADDVLSLNQVANTGTLQSATNNGQGQTDLLANREDGARVIALERQEVPLQREEEHSVEKTEQTLTMIDSSMLKDDQYRAYNIITWQLEQVLAGAKPPLLCQILHGEGGTGKSKVIQTVTQHFLLQGARYMLIKAAYTGIAASIIEGKATHTIAMISQHNLHKALSEESKWKLQEFWREYAYLIINEMSMISKTFFTLLSPIIISIAKTTVGVDTSTDSFGGINIIICGDFHQFLPVAALTYEALYYPANIQKDSTDALLGHAIYEEFITVVILKEQIHCIDPVWLDFSATPTRWARARAPHQAVGRLGLE